LLRQAEWEEVKASGSSSTNGSRGMMVWERGKENVVLRKLEYHQGERDLSRFQLDG
jgi:hypothetical protein